MRTLDVDELNAMLEGGDAAPEASPSREDTWPDPISLGRAAPDPFPVHLLPSWLRSWVLAEAEELQVGPGLPAAAALGVLSAAVGSRLTVNVRGSWSEPCNLFLMALARPSERKSPVFAHAADPLRQVEREIREDQAEEIDAREELRLEIEAALKAARKQLKGGDEGERASARNEIAELRERLRSSPPMHPRVISIGGDCTPEALADRLAQQGERLAVISAEGTFFSVISGRYSTRPNLELVLQAYSGEPYEAERKGASTRLESPALTIGIAVQPDVLKATAEHREFAERGVLARFLYVMPESKAGSRKLEPRVMPLDVAETYRRRVGDLARWAERNTAGLSLNTKARAQFLRFQKEIEPHLAEGGELDNFGWGGKIAGNVVRLAGLLHAAEQGENFSREISEETMSAAAEIGRVLISHVHAAFGVLSDDGDEDASRLLGWLEGRGDHVRLREITQKGPRSSRRRADALRAARVLEDAGYLRWRATVRKDSIAWDLHPSIRGPK